MRRINLETWPRRKHFEMFNAWDYPHFNMCANLELTAFHQAVKERGVSIFVAITYVIARAANEIPEFRQRIHGKAEVVEHDIVHPSITILSKDDLFSFCLIEYTQDFHQFSARAAEQIAHRQEHPTLEDPPGDDNLLFMSVIPWVSFTSFMHPINLGKIDSVPRFAWGKFFQEGASWKMPLNVQAHHALMDGFHMGKFYLKAQELFDQPESTLEWEVT